MSLALQIQNLSKCYSLPISSGQGGYRTLRESMTESSVALFRRLFGKGASATREFWALKEINLEIQQGDSLGIVGANGAGKSTLLKILSRVTSPTSGVVNVWGSLSSLLEVGVGFHPELTGRENIFLNGAILGMGRGEIRARFDQIVEFSEVEQFLDVPIKRYSSGMFVRLAFAVAAHLEPDILLIDEVLAVGDLGFQKKCLGRMNELVNQGRTILFVSHNLPAVRNLCRRAILLEKGGIKMEGTAAEVVEHYLNSHAPRANEVRWEAADRVSPDQHAALCGIRLLNGAGEPAISAALEESITVEIEYEVFREGTSWNLSMSLFTAEDVHVCVSPSTTDSQWCQRPHPKGIYRSRCLIPGGLLNQGTYFFSVLLVENTTQVVDRADRAVRIEMVDTGERRQGYFGPWLGAVRPTFSWQTQSASRVTAEPTP